MSCLCHRCETCTSHHKKCNCNRCTVYECDEHNSKRKGGTSVGKEKETTKRPED